MDIYWLAAVLLPSAILFKKISALPRQTQRNSIELADKCGFNPRFMEQPPPKPVEQPNADDSSSTTEAKCGFNPAFMNLADPSSHKTDLSL
jgi:hypothetical protein